MNETLYFSIGAFAGVVVWALEIILFKEEEPDGESRFMVCALGAVSWVFCLFLWPVAFVGALAWLLAKSLIFLKKLFLH